MELELMFSDQKWNILKCLSEGKYSPIQLAEKLNTTMANISQQMRLLEAANLVKKEKIRNRDKGKPRALFSLTEECAYIIPTMHNFADKKLLKVNDQQKFMLKIWFVDDDNAQQALERLYCSIRNQLKIIKLILYKNGEVTIAADNIDSLKKVLTSTDIPIKVILTKDAEKLYSGRIYSDPSLRVLHVSKGSSFERGSEVVAKK